MAENIKEINEPFPLETELQHFMLSEAQLDLSERPLFNSLDEGEVQNMELFEALLQEKNHENATITSIAEDNFQNERKADFPQSSQALTGMTHIEPNTHLHKRKRIIKERKVSEQTHKRGEGHHNAGRRGMKLVISFKPKPEQTVRIQQNNCTLSCLQKAERKLTMPVPSLTLDDTDDSDPFRTDQINQRNSIAPQTNAASPLDYQSYLSLN